MLLVKRDFEMSQTLRKFLCARHATQLDVFKYIQKVVAKKIEKTPRPQF